MIGLCILTFLFSIIQVTLLRNIAIFQITPDIVLILIVYIALFHEKPGMWVGFFAGLFMDLYSSCLGYNALLGTVIGYGVGRFAGRVYKEIFILWIVLLFGSSMSWNIIIFAVQKELSLYFLGRYIILESLYTTLVGLIIFSALRRIEMRAK